MSALAAIVYQGDLLLTREKRGRVSKLSLPGGKPMPGETLGQTTAREANVETGFALSASTRSSIESITAWRECAPAQQHVGVLYLPDESPNGTIHERFNGGTASKSNSKTVHEGLE